MFDATTALLTGLAAGSLHVLSGPDHLAALAPMAARAPWRALRIGATWGIGHGIGVVGLGALGVLGRDLINVDAISAWSEFIVGVLLLVVGLWAIRSALLLVLPDPTQTHPPVADAQGHLKPHALDPGRLTWASAAGFGLLHGVAGTGHLFGVIPSLGLPPNLAMLYLGAYVVAAIAAMALFGLLIGRVTSLGGERMLRGAMVACGAFAVLVGGFWIIQAWPPGTVA